MNLDINVIGKIKAEKISVDCPYCLHPITAYVRILTSEPIPHTKNYDIHIKKGAHYYSNEEFECEKCHGVFEIIIRKKGEE